MSALTPVEQYGLCWAKRDDAFSVAGVRGGKARSALAIMQQAHGLAGVVTAGSRHSPQVVIVAMIAQHLGYPCWAHVPAGPDTPELIAAQAAGAVLVRERPGHNSVIKARAREHAERSGLLHIPFGMECQEAVAQTAEQVQNLPHSAVRLVVPVGSGMSLAGILQGLRRYGRAMQVLGVRVGADPSRNLDRYAPGWRTMLNLRIVDAGVPYEQRVHAQLGGLVLDPVYEAKCVRFLSPCDCLWVVGVRPGVGDAA